MNEIEIKKMLDELGYHHRWLDYGFLSVDELKIQYAQYIRAKTDPESDEADLYGYQDTEHLRHHTFVKISKEYKSFTDEELEKLIELVEIDGFRMMALNFYCYILKNQSVTEEQIKKYNIKCFY